jgi:hypothetical protein
MLLHKEKIELEENKECISLLIDDVLDLYNKYPKECHNILLELNEISNEFEEIQKEIEKIENTIE